MDIVPVMNSLPPGGLLEIVFSFDTTGSMSSVLEEVQGRLQDMIQRLQADIPGIRIGVIAHGDYCDKDVFYLTKQIDSCSDIKELCDFVQGVEGTGGGDQDECYELILRMVRKDFSWTPSSTRILVMIGDANPHEPDYELNTDNIDWREEIQLLHKDMDVKIYGVQVFENEGAEGFYRTLAEQTNGHYFKLGEFSNICDFLMAICYRERGEDFLTGYEKEVRSRYNTIGMHKDLEGLFGALRRTESSQSTSSRTGVLSSCSSIPLAAVAPLPMPIAITPLPPTPAASIKIKKTIVKKIRTPTKQNIKISKKLKNIKTSMIEREKTRFQCPGLKWSAWKLAWTYKDPNNRQKWTKCRNRDGWKRKLLYKRKTNKRVLYEVSVKTNFTGKRGKRLVAYHTLLNVNNCMHKEIWQKELFSHGKRRLQRNVNYVLDSKCDIFVRRAFIGRRKVQVQKSLQKYDYAWNSSSKKYPNEKLKRNEYLIHGV